jgi:hypothetical protein
VVRARLKERGMARLMEVTEDLAMGLCCRDYLEIRFSGRRGQACWATTGSKGDKSSGNLDPRFRHKFLGPPKDPIPKPGAVWCELQAGQLGAHHPKFPPHLYIHTHDDDDDGDTVDVRATILRALFL